MTQRCGYVALLGRPNAGKSTLLNALVGDKLAVVSRKPQTTRNRILGVITTGESQLVFLDTPGVHQAKGKPLLNTTMNKVALAAAADADLIVYLIDASVGFSDADLRSLDRVLGSSSARFAILLSKVDALKQHVVEKRLTEMELRIESLLQSERGQAWAARRISLDPAQISAKRPEMVEGLRDFLAAELPAAQHLFAADDLTDRPQSFLVSELIREQLFRQLGQEIPYGCAVRTNKIEMKPDLVVINAELIVSRRQHKAMVVGKGGSRIKEIGVEARASLERHFEKKIFLELNVSVEEGWINDQKLLAELAHIQEIETPASFSGDGSDFTNA